MRTTDFPFAKVRTTGAVIHWVVTTGPACDTVVEVAWCVLAVLSRALVVVSVLLVVCVCCFMLELDVV